MSINIKSNQQHSTLSATTKYSNVNKLTTSQYKTIDTLALVQQKDIISISNEAKNMQLAANTTAKSTSLLDTAKDWASSTVSWLKKAGQFVVDAAKAGIDFLVLDDVKTIFNPNAGTTEKGLALVSLFPAGKVTKSGKLFELLKKSGKSIEVNAFAGLGKVQKFNSKGILLDGNSSTGWDHINKRHVTGTAATKGTTLFPKSLSDAQIKNLIMESLQKGTLKSTHSDGTKVYTYNPQKYGISEMTTVVTKDNIIKTSYPVSGTSVIKK